MKNKMLDSAAWIIIVVAIGGLAFMKYERQKEHGSFPDRPISLICPFSAGGGTDLICRKLAHEAEKRLGVSVLVNNITGGGGAVGHAAGRLAAGDGYTILSATFELISLPVQGLVPFTYKDFDLMLLLNMDPAAVAVRADYPADSLEEFIRKGRSGEPISIGNSGAGAVWHLAASMLADKTGLQAIHVPFDGASQAITALIGGHIDAVTVSPAELQTYVQSGQVKILAVMSDIRLKNFPDVPTCRSEGVDLVFGTWRGLALPVGVAAETRSLLQQTFREVASSDEFVEFARQSGMNLHILDTKDFNSMVEKQSKEVEEMMSRLGLVR